MQTNYFLLVPDSGAARRLRRTLAEKTPCMGVQVGTWPELITQAKSAYLIAEELNDWNQIFHDALKNISDAFWSQSFAVAPNETAAEVETSLSLIVGATYLSLEGEMTLGDFDQLPERPRKHINDIFRLVAELNGRLPKDLEDIQKLIKADRSNTIRNISVSHINGFPALSSWQAALIEKLNKDSDARPDKAIRTELESLCSKDIPDPLENSATFMQEYLFSELKEKMLLDESVQWVGVRDYLQEAEVAASMAQEILLKNPELSTSDIGLLLPDDFEYSLGVKDAFTKAGIPLSGLPVDHWQRDLGKAALFHFLYCRQKPSPAMALAVCLSSPLMPWSREQGAVLAQKVMDGNYGLRSFSAATQADKQMLDLLGQGDETPQSLVTALRSFVNLLDGGEKYDSHMRQARLLVEELCTALEISSEIDWMSLRRLSSPKNISTGDSSDFNLGGVTVWREGQEPWRPVRFLIVLGFSSGHYPLSSKDSAIFVSDDLIAIQQTMGLAISTPTDQMEDQRKRFKRQLGAVSDSMTFMVPRRDPPGASLSPSESLVFMSQLFSDHDEADSLILELDVGSDRGRINYLPAAEVCDSTLPREIVVEDIKFDFDLLKLRLDKEGNLKPESPSSLETLMVSRFAWLLRRINATPLGWEPERLNVMLQGTLTHQVFEDLFQASTPIPEPPSIRDQVPKLLDSAISAHTPFLQAPQWQVEREYLMSSIQEAALAWLNVLKTIDAKVLGTEEWLAGSLDGLPIHGQVDILLGLPDGRMLVVDYKKSSAGSRKPRMEKGYDSQADLYRTMLNTGGPKNEENKDLLERLRAGDTTGIVYFMTNDQTSLTDTALIESGSIPGWVVLSNDVAQQAMALIKKRLKEVSEGKVVLNREGDEVFFEKQTGIAPYALGSSNLIPLFTLSDEIKEAE